jgi:hypothetical protein
VSHLRLLGSLINLLLGRLALSHLRLLGSLINLLLCRLALSHLRLLGSLFVASYDSQGLRWKYSYPPPHGVDTEHTQTSMPPVGFEPTISVLERAKTVHALDRTAECFKCRFMFVYVVIS